MLKSILYWIRQKPFPAFALAHSVLFMGPFLVLAILRYHGTGALELTISEWMLAGRVPYSDFAFEYPPLALLSFILPALVFTTLPAYSVLFALQMLALDLVVMLLLAWFAHRWGISVTKTLIAYTLLAVAVGPILVCRYDMLPAALTLLSLAAFVQGRVKLSWAILALGTLAKLYPVLLAPLFVLYQLRERQPRQLIAGLGSFLAVTAAIVLPFMVIAPDGFIQSFAYHLQRGIQAESTYGTALLSADLLDYTTVHGVFNYGSWNLSAPIADFWAKMSLLLSTGSLALVYALFAALLWRNWSQSDDGRTPLAARESLLLAFAVLVIGTFLITSKVFSAQYVVWLLPLIPLVSGTDRHVLVTFFAAAALTQVVYPYFYSEFQLEEPLFVSLLSLRNLLLVIMCGAIAGKFFFAAVWHRPERQRLHLPALTRPVEHRH